MWLKRGDVQIIREHQCNLYQRGAIAVIIVTIIFHLFFKISCANSQSVYVPLNHWVYNFIERLETKHVIQYALNQTEPLSRQEITEYLIQIYKKVDQGYQLNRVEQEQLNYLTIEFKEELPQNTTLYQTRINKIKNNRYVRKLLPRIIYQNDRNFLSWNQDQFRVFFDPILYYHREYSNIDSLHNTEKVYQLTNGACIWGNFGDRLGFFIDARDNKEWGTKKYRIGNYTLPGLGFVRATSSDFIYHDETNAYIKIGFNYVQFTYGKFKNYWGPGYTGSLILSEYATSYDQFKFQLRYKKFNFTSIYAYLIDYHNQEGDSLQQRKHLAGHRLEFMPWTWLSIGLSETVIFKGRNFEPAYLNPVMFFRSAEHYLGSPDNMMMGLDFKFVAVKNIKLYGELLIDDITTSKLGTNWYGNKLGLLSGIFFADFCAIDNLDLRFEYVRIRPYVYSHENSLTYTQYGSLLGHQIGSNTDLFFTVINYYLTRCFRIQCTYSYLRHGANSTSVNFGGNYNRYYVEGDNTYPQFLSGLRESDQNITFNLSYEIFRDFYFKLKILRNQAKHTRNTESNLDATSFVFFTSLGINY